MGRQQPLQPFNKNNNNTSGAVLSTVTASAKSKQMVKQHSTASQQSTSSTSSSVHSAPDQTGKQQSPSRVSTGSLERQIMTQHHHHHPTTYNYPASSIQTTYSNLDKDLLLTSSVTTLQSLGQLKSDDMVVTNSSLTNSNISTESFHSDNQQNVSDKSNTENTTASTTLKKRRKGLRFGFGSKKSSSHSSQESNTKSK